MLIQHFWADRLRDLDSQVWSHGVLIVLKLEVGFLCSRIIKRLMSDVLNYIESYSSMLTLFFFSFFFALKKKKKKP